MPVDMGAYPYPGRASGLPAPAEGDAGDRPETPDSRVQTPIGQAGQDSASPSLSSSQASPALTPLEGAQRTVAGEVQLGGISLHGGKPVRLSIHPARAGHGIRFRRTDCRDGEVAARWDHVSCTRLCTAIANEQQVQVRTIEHLMSAFFALGIDNALVCLDGEELPALDGSAAPWVEALREVGLVTQQAPRRILEIRHPVQVSHGEAGITLAPAGDFRVRCRIDYRQRGVAIQEAGFSRLEDRFHPAISRARTFGFSRDADALWAAGFARGSSLGNTVVLDGEACVLNAGGMRFENELARHKLLDTLGDLYLAGPIRGACNAIMGGHTLTNRLLRALFALPDAFAWVETG